MSTTGISWVATLTLFRKLRLILDRCAFSIWRAICTILGHFRASRESWGAEGGRRVLVVAPHPDDEVLGCGGTMACHLAAGDLVHVVVVTDGRRSRAVDLGPEAMAATRHGEATAAATLLGVTRLRWLGFEEGDWQAKMLESALAGVIADFRPEIIYAPCWLDYHPEHRRVAECLGRVVPATTTLRVYTLHVPLNRLVNVWVDVSAEMPLLRKLFEAYETQCASLLRGLRVRRYAAALNRCGRGTEEFWELSGQSYRNAHPPNTDPPVVRGMRFWSFSDPLSYIVGMRARRTVARRSDSAAE